MKVQTLKKIIDSLPDAHTYELDIISVEYFPEYTNVQSKESKPPVRWPSVTILFRRTYTFYGMDWELMDIKILTQ